jgi:hypothetical protein
VLTLVFDATIVAPDPGERELCVWRDPEGELFARALAHGERRWLIWNGLGTVTFVLGSTTVHARPADGIDRAVFADAFARVLQPIILQALGFQSLHASAVLGWGGVVAFCGVSHSGKSTLAFALAQDGYRQVADDAVVIERMAGGVDVRLLPFAASLRAGSRQHFAASTADPGDRGAGAAIAGGAREPLGAVFVLSQLPGLTVPAAPRRIAPVHAFASLMTHARCFDEGDAAHTRQLIDDYLYVAERVPVFELCYPAQFGQLSALVETIKETARSVGIVPLAPAGATAVSCARD